MHSRPAVDGDRTVCERGLEPEDLPASFVPLDGVDLLPLGVVVTAQPGPLPGHDEGGQGDLPQYEGQAGAHQEGEEEEEEGTGHRVGAALLALRTVSVSSYLEAVRPSLGLSPCLPHASPPPHLMAASQLSWNNSHFVSSLFSPGPAQTWPRRSNQAKTEIAGKANEL